MNRTKQALVAAGLSAGLLGGGAAGLILGSPGVSGAQDSATTTTVVAQQNGSNNQQGTADRPDPSARLKETLDPLVKNGTINQSQEDAVVKALSDAHQADGRGGPGGRHGGPQLDAAAKALGISTDDLRTALRDGQTIAQVASSKNVPVQQVIDAMVADVKAHLDQEVKDGEHTQAEADQRLQDATSRITDMVKNGMKPPADRPNPPDAPAQGGN